VVYDPDTGMTVKYDPGEDVAFVPSCVSAAVVHTPVTYWEGAGSLHVAHTVSAHAWHASDVYCFEAGEQVLHCEVHAVVRPIDVEKVPAAHDVQYVAPKESEYVPAAHGIHVDALVAPMTDDEVPIGHRAHVDAFVAPTTLE
jgi:hypothetical protein